MAPRVRDVLAQPGVDLVVRAGAHRLDDRIRWVATSEYLDPTPFLDGGELLLSTGMLLPHDAGEIRAYVDRLAGAGVIGLGLGVDLVLDETPSALIAAAEEAGLLLLEVPHPVPFIAISKAVSNLIAKERYAETVRAAQAQQDLTRAALRDGAAGIVRTTARLLDGWAVVLDRDQVVQHAHPVSARNRVTQLGEELTRLGTAGPAASSVMDGEEHLSLSTLAASRHTHGYLVVGMRRHPRLADRALVTMAASLLTVTRVSLTRSSAGSAEQRRIVALVRLTRGGEPDGALLADLGGPLFRRPELQVMSVAGGSRELGSLHVALQGESAQDCLAVRDGRTVLAIMTPRLASTAVHLVDRFRSLHAGVSEPLPPTSLSVAFDQAGRVRDRAVARQVGVMHHGDTLAGAHSVADPGDAATFAQRLLEPLVDYERRTGNDLLESLAVWLRHHGHYEPAAAEFGLHRHTLRDRVRRAEQLLGHSLDDVDARMDLWYALRALPSTDAASVAAYDGVAGRAGRRALERSRAR